MDPLPLLLMVLAAAILSSTCAAAQTAQWSCDFTSTSCGFTQSPSGGVMNVSSSTSADLNGTSFTWQNVSMDVWCPASAIGLKARPSTGAGSDDWLWECDADDCTLKNENSYSLSLGGFPVNAWTNTWMTFNRTANSTSIFWTGKASVSSANSFDILQDDSFQFSTTYSGGDCLIDNMTMYVLDSEVVTDWGGGGSPVTLNTSIQDGILNASATGWNSETRATNYERLIRSFRGSGNVTRYATINGKELVLVPHFTASNVCGEANLQTSCSTGGNFSSFPMVTDEWTEYCLPVAMSQNSTEETEAARCYNTLLALNSTSDGHGLLPEWRVVYDNTTGTPTLVKTCVADDASDANARAIKMLAAMSRNPAFRNDTILSEAAVNATLTTMCTDFLEYNFVYSVKTSYVNSSRTIKYWAGGGSNVATAITNNDYGYTGYMGDIAQALGICAAHTGNGTFAAAGQDVFEQYFAASNWTPSTGYIKVPPGRSFEWSNAPAPIASCTTICDPTYADDPDGKRWTKICAAAHLYTNVLLVQAHPWMSEYCGDVWADPGVTNTTYSVEWWYDNSTDPSKSTATDGAGASGIAGFLDILGNVTNVASRYAHIGSKFDTTNGKYYEYSCQGVYEAGFTAEFYMDALYTQTLFKNSTVLSSTSTPAITLDVVRFLSTQSPMLSEYSPVGQANVTYTGTESLVNYTYAWYLNGTLNETGTLGGQNGTLIVNVSNLTAGFLVKGYNLTLQVGASDGVLTSALRNISITVANTPPSLSTVAITQSSSTLLCTYLATDYDEDTLTPTYSWFNSTGNLSETTSSLDASAISIGELITCQVSVTDGSGSDILNSSAHAVQESSSGGGGGGGGNVEQPSRAWYAPPSMPLVTGTHVLMILGGIAVLGFLVWRLGA